jgi:hypothetical protein
VLVREQVLVDSLEQSALGAGLELHLKMFVDLLDKNSI